jgi:hypothetical protein
MSNTPLWVTALRPKLIKLLIITENYPGNPKGLNGSTYFYRSLLPNASPKGPNNLLNNLCSALNIGGNTEIAKLNNFLKRGYFLIDSYPSGANMSPALISRTTSDTTYLNNFIQEIKSLNPDQIIFTCKGSNKYLLKEIWLGLQKNNLHHLIKSEKGTLPNNPIKLDEFKDIIFNSPSNRAFAVFKQQIIVNIQSKNLVP